MDPRQSDQMLISQLTRLSARATAVVVLIPPPRDHIIRAVAASYIGRMGNMCIPRSDQRLHDLCTVLTFRRIQAGLQYTNDLKPFRLATIFRSFFEDGLELLFPIEKTYQQRRNRGKRTN